MGRGCVQLLRAGAKGGPAVEVSDRTSGVVHELLLSARLGALSLSKPPTCEDTVMRQNKLGEGAQRPQGEAGPGPGWTDSTEAGRGGWLKSKSATRLPSCGAFSRTSGRGSGRPSVLGSSR